MAADPVFRRNSFEPSIKKPKQPFECLTCAMLRFQVLLSHKASWHLADSRSLVDPFYGTCQVFVVCVALPFKA